MKPFWRDNPLSEKEQALLDSVLAAHRESCFRENISSVAVKMAAAAKVSMFQSFAAALSTLGGMHGPVEQTHRLLAADGPAMEAMAYLDRGEKVPGWGNSFYRGIPDPLWKEAASLLETHFLSISNAISDVTALLYVRGFKLFPNPSAYTAAAGIALGMTEHLSAYLLIEGRSSGWAELYYKQRI